MEKQNNCQINVNKIQDNLNLNIFIYFFKKNLYEN